MPQSNKPRVAIYDRISTGESKQTSKNKLWQLRQYDKDYDFTIIHGFVDDGSSINDKRSQF